MQLLSRRCVKEKCLTFLVYQVKYLIFLFLHLIKRGDANEEKHYITKEKMIWGMHYQCDCSAGGVSEEIFTLSCVPGERFDLSPVASDDLVFIG